MGKTKESFDSSPLWRFSVYAKERKQKLAIKEINNIISFPSNHLIYMEASEKYIQYEGILF